MRRVRKYEVIISYCEDSNDFTRKADLYVDGDAVVTANMVRDTYRWLLERLLEQLSDTEIERVVNIDGRDITEEVK